MTVSFIIAFTLCVLNALTVHSQYYNRQVRVDSLDNSYIFQVTYKKVQTHSLHFYYWFKSGRIHYTQGSYYGKLLHGYYKVIDKERRLLQQGRFRLGEKKGAWRSWYPNGFLKSRQRIRFWDGSNHLEEFSDSGIRTKNGFSKNQLFSGFILENVNDSLIKIYYKKGVKQPVSKK